MPFPKRCLVNGTIIALALALGVPSSSAPADSGESRPEHFGRILPYLAEQPVRVAADPPFTPVEQIVPVELAIDTTGKVTRVARLTSVLPESDKYLNTYFDQVRFEPGLVHYRPAAMRLKVLVSVLPPSHSPLVIYPVNADGRIISHDLYFESMALNGVSLPRLDTFPKFSCYIGLRDSIIVTPSALLAVDLDEQGDIEERRVVLSNSHIPSSQLRSLILWSEFTPMVVDGESRAARVYVVVTCFPHVSYPATPDLGLKNDSVPMQHRYQVRLLYDTVGVLVPAIPRRLKSDRTVYRAGPPQPSYSVSAWVRTDTLGRARVMRFSPTTDGTRRFVYAIADDFKFHPALGFSGQPVPFEGLMQFRVLNKLNEPNIRISYFWHP